MESEEFKEKVSTYFKYLHEILNTDITDEMLNSVNIKSVTLIEEALTNNPAPPRLIIKKMDGTEEKIDGYVEIPTYLGKLLEDIENQNGLQQGK